MHKLQHKELADKYMLRILRSLTDPELSNLLRRYGQKSRGVSRHDKIAFVMHAGIPVSNILLRDIFEATDNQGQRKDRVKLLMEDLGLNVSRLGTTLQNRVSILMKSMQSNAEAEFELLSVSGFKELIDSLSDTIPPVLERLRDEFEIEESEDLEPERLRALGISPLDILYVYTNDEVKAIRDAMGLPKRNNPRLAILNSFASANDKLLEHYELLASRDLAGLQAVGISIKEAEIGAKFEEITKTIFEQLGLKVDEELRKQVSAKKDRPDVILSLGDEDVIIGEVKSYKNGDFAKYSSTSRQVKSYVNRCEGNGNRVSQVLIVSPGFSPDFIESAEMDTEVNISLLESAGLKKILEAYKARRKPKFSARLLTKGGLLKSDLIAKSI
ncbi:hypothetical protein [Endozoicomonas sp. ALD040]|uniref:hypothetical protein n=1 Tax=Endozoicomonas sp. ALD040 TaxID=3403079 RepID=UPI003BB050F8